MFIKSMSARFDCFLFLVYDTNKKQNVFTQNIFKKMFKIVFGSDFLCMRTIFANRMASQCNKRTLLRAS